MFNSIHSNQHDPISVGSRLGVIYEVHTNAQVSKLEMGRSKTITAMYQNQARNTKLIFVRICTVENAIIMSMCKKRNTGGDFLLL